MAGCRPEKRGAERGPGQLEDPEAASEVLLELGLARPLSGLGSWHTSGSYKSPLAPRLFLGPIAPQ